jgi:hypothetical protein
MSADNVLLSLAVAGIVGYCFFLKWCFGVAKRKHEALLQTHSVTYRPWGKTYIPKSHHS